MKKTIGNISLVLALSLCSCTASEKTQMNGLEKDASRGLKTLGKEADKAGHEITAAVRNRRNGSSKGAEGSKPRSGFDKEASKAMTSLGTETDKGVRAIASAVKGIGKSKNTANTNENGKNGSGGSVNDSMSEFGRNASNAGATMGKSMSSMGKQAADQIERTEKAIESNNKGQGQHTPFQM